MSTQRRIVARAVSTQKGVTSVVASTDTPDRAGDVVEQSWVLDNFRANPVIVWAHDYSLPPVGKASNIRVEDGALQMDITWDTGSELGATVARQFEEGFLSAVSVGFVPGKAVSRSSLDPEDPMKADKGFLFRDNELLELSAVPVPMNPQALAQRGLTPPAPATLELDELVAWVTAALEPVIERASPRDQYEIDGIDFSCNNQDLDDWWWDN